MEFLELIATLVIILFGIFTTMSYKAWIKNTIEQQQQINEDSFQMEPLEEIHEDPKLEETIEINPKNLVNSNTISNEVYEKEIEQKIKNIKDINKVAEIFQEKDVIPINKDETNSFLISKVMAQKTPQQEKESEKLKEDLNLSIQNKINENGGMKTFFNKIVNLKQESVEFTMVALNECFKQSSDAQILFQKEAFNDEVHKYYLNNLICSGENKTEKVTIFFEDNDQYSFDEMKSNEKKSKEFIQNIEDIFYSKFPKSEGYYIDFSTIVKGSKGAVFSSNLSDTQLNDFLKEIGKHKQFGSISSHNKTQALNDLKISANMFDSRGNIDFGNLGGHEKRGGLDYYQPKGWKRMGLKVIGLYDGGKDDWLAMNGNSNEWAVAFHGTNIQYVNAISQTNIVEGAGQACISYQNLNTLNQNKYPQCGKGVYFGQCIEVSDGSGYCPAFNVNGQNMKVAFQCRVNPKEVRITNYGSHGCKKAVIVPNSKTGCYDNIRPYGILVKLV